MFVLNEENVFFYYLYFTSILFQKKKIIYIFADRKMEVYR